MERKSKVTQSAVNAACEQLQANSKNVNIIIFIKGRLMKKPDMKSLEGLTPDDAFTQTAKAENDKAQKVAKKTFSLQQRDIDFK
jgi:hypothetical protein